jgi:hypothetical protein
MDLRAIGLGGVDWIRLAQDSDRWRAVVSAMYSWKILQYFTPHAYFFFEQCTNWFKESGIFGSSVTTHHLRTLY